MKDLQCFFVICVLCSVYNAALSLMLEKSVYGDFILSALCIKLNLQIFCFPTSLNGDFMLLSTLEVNLNGSLMECTQLSESAF